MEESSSYPRGFNINLKHLPPINPRIGNHPSIQGRFEKPRNTRYIPLTPPNRWQEIKPNGANGTPRELVPSDPLNMKTIPFPEASSSSANFLEISSDRKNEVSGEKASTCSCRHDSIKEGTPKKGVSKSLLFEICTANHWNPPLFECCKEEGPSHAKTYMFKVIVEMKGASSSTVLECYGAPQTRKKVAAEHAAEGALWYLKHLAYFPKT